MNIEEAYRVMQENSGIEVGDKVRVLRKAKRHEMGWWNSWESSMDSSVGKVLTVLGVYDNGIRLTDYSIKYKYPFFVLEIVEKHNDKKKVVIDGKEVWLSKESFEALKKSLLEE